MGLRRAIAIGALLAACGDNKEPPEDFDTIVTVLLETHAPAVVTAGDAITVSCTLLENGIESTVTGEITVMDEASVARTGGLIVARTAGTVYVACTLPDRGLVDVTPVAVEIVAGAPANVVTTITPNPVTAGNSVTATCEVYDAYGNLVEGTSPTLQLSPTDSANTISGLMAEMIRAGHYTGRCDLPGTTSNNAAFDVVPNLPATLLISKLPDLPVYAIGNTVEIQHVVADRYGNEITNPDVTTTSAPITGVGPTLQIDPITFQYNGEGLYRATAVVNPPTDNNVTLSASTDILVNSRGPAITCAGDATMINMTPGGTLTVSGTASDVNGVASLTVNGTAVTLSSTGTWSTTVTTRWGMNFVDVSATDTFGEPTTKVCTYLISNRYAAPASPIPDTVSLKLTQAAVDDMDRSGALDSFGDILHTIVNSQGLKDAVHNQLLAQNPLKPMSCDSQSCTFLGCVCWYRSEVTYISSVFNGPHTVSLTLVNGGLYAVARFDNLAVKLRVRGDVLGVGYDTTGWVYVQYVQVALTLDTAIANGLPRITVRPGSVSTSVGAISTDFSGVDGWIIDNIVVPLAQGSLKSMLANVITGYVQNNFNAALDGLMSNLSIATLGTTFNVPRIDGTGTVAMAFAVAFSSLNTTAARMLFGIATRFTTTAANAYPSLGVPLPPGTTNLTDPSVTSPVNTAVGAHVGIFEHALHALWRANYFAATLTGTQLGGNLPAGVALVITTRLPPVANILSNGTVQLQVGAMDIEITHPDLPAGLIVRFGADAHASVTLVGNDLVFGNVVVDTVHVSTDVVNLSASQQQSLQTALQLLAQQLVAQSLNNSLPAIPIPSFTIPASLSVYGLPAGRRIGLNSPALSVAPQWFTLRGQFGLLP